MSETFEEAWKRMEKETEPSELRKKCDAMYEEMKKKKVEKEPVESKKEEKSWRKAAFDALARTDGKVEATRVYGPREELPD